MALEAVTQGTVTSNTLEGYTGTTEFFHKAQDKGLWVCVAHLSPRNPKASGPASA